MAAFRLCLIIVLSLIAQSLQQDPIVDLCVVLSFTDSI